MKQNIFMIGIAMSLVIASGCSTNSNESNQCTGLHCDTGEAPVDGGPTGMGAVCTAADSCSSYEADYCVEVPGQSGYCSIKDCSIETDDCPGDYVCCDYVPEGYPNICLSAAKWEQYSSFLCTNS